MILDGFVNQRGARPKLGVRSSKGTVARLPDCARGAPLLLPSARIPSPIKRDEGLDALVAVIDPVSVTHAHAKRLGEV